VLTAGPSPPVRGQSTLWAEKFGRRRGRRGEIPKVQSPRLPSFPGATLAAAADAGADAD